MVHAVLHAHADASFFLDPQASARASHARQMATPPLAASATLWCGCKGPCQSRPASGRALLHCHQQLVVLVGYLLRLGCTVCASLARVPSAAAQTHQTLHAPTGGRCSQASMQACASSSDALGRGGHLAGAAKQIFQGAVPVRSTPSQDRSAHKRSKA